MGTLDFVELPDASRAKSPDSALSLDSTRRGGSSSSLTSRLIFCEMFGGVSAEVEHCPLQYSHLYTPSYYFGWRVPRISRPDLTRGVRTSSQLFYPKCALYVLHKLVSKMAGASPASSPRLPSPPPMAEDQLGPMSPTAALSEESGKLGGSMGDTGASRRIAPGTRAEDMGEGPPLVDVSKVRAAFFGT